MPNQEIRWIQRFNNYRSALTRLTDAVQLTKTRELSDLEQQGLIQAFEFTYDLAWKTLQDLLREKGKPGSNGGPNVILTQAAAEGFIKSLEGWKAIKKSREMTSHTYNAETADEIAENVVDWYHSLFIQLETRLQLEKINQEKQG